MKICQSLSVATLLLLSGNIWAAQNCNNGGNKTSELHPASTSSKKRLSKTLTSGEESNVVIPGESYIQSTSLIKCDDTTSTTKQKTATFNISAGGSNISTQTKNFNGLSYYKLVNTSSQFLNNYGYIYFKYSDNSNGATQYELSNQNGNIRSGVSYTQGVRIYGLSIAFEKAPIQPLTDIPIDLGKLIVNWSGNSDPTYNTRAEQTAQILLSVIPYSQRTCNVNNPIINLWVLPTNTLIKQGDTSGKTNFTVTANCSLGLNNTHLDAVMVDNQDVKSANTDYATKGILINTSKNNGASNVAIQVTNSDTNKPVELGKEHSFGTTSPNIARHNYFATYYKLDNAATKAGKITATATVTVSYK